MEILRLKLAHTANCPETLRRIVMWQQRTPLSCATSYLRHFHADSLPRWHVWLKPQRKLPSHLCRVLLPQQNGAAAWCMEAGLLASSRCDLDRHGPAGTLRPTSTSGPSRSSAPRTGLCGSALYLWEVKHTWLMYLGYCRIFKGPISCIISFINVF